MSVPVVVDHDALIGDAGHSRADPMHPGLALTGAVVVACAP
jgi:hypothetical protein